MRNPYSAILEHMREQGGKNNTPYVEIGLVVSADPLVIKLGDLQIGKENLLVAAELLPGYERQITLDGIPKNLAYTDGFQADDTVALIPTLDGQTYIVLTKVVSP